MSYVRKKLSALRHGNGAVVCTLYGDLTKVSLLLLDQLYSSQLFPTIVSEDILFRNAERIRNTGIHIQHLANSLFLYKNLHY